MTNAEAFAQLESWMIDYGNHLWALLQAQDECALAECRPVSGGRPPPMYLGLVRAPDGWCLITTAGFEEIQLKGPVAPTLALAVQGAAPEINEKIARLQSRAQRWQRIANAVKGL